MLKGVAIYEVMVKSKKGLKPYLDMCSSVGLVCSPAYMGVAEGTLHKDCLKPYLGMCSFAGLVCSPAYMGVAGRGILHRDCPKPFL